MPGRSPARRRGRPAAPVAAGCVFWQDAGGGAIATGPADHAHCAIGTFTHNLHTDPAHETDRRDALRVFADLGYVRPEDIPGIPVLAERPRTIVYAPLATTPLPPDVVLLFVQADQTLILAEASQSVDGGLAPAMGRPACAVVPHVHNTGRGRPVARLLRRPRLPGRPRARGRPLRPPGRPPGRVHGPDRRAGPRQPGPHRVPPAQAARRGGWAITDCPRVAGRDGRGSGLTRGQVTAGRSVGYFS